MSVKSGADVSIGRWGSGLGPSLFVVIVLLAVLLVPILVDRRVDQLRNEVAGAAEPARALVAELHYVLARSTLEMRQFLATGDSVHYEEYRRLTLQEAAIYPELERYAATVSPELNDLVAHLRALSRQWHERADRARSGPDPPAPDAVAWLVDDDLSVRILDAGARVEQALRDGTVIRRRQIRDVEELARIVFLVLLALAFGATIAVATLNVRIRRLIGVANTGRVQAEGALRNSARANEARSDLIRGFTHDVKNPLGAADGYAHLLQAGLRGELTPEQSDTVASIRGSIRSAIEIIEELLDLSRLETGGLQIQRERVDCRELVLDVVRQNSGSAVDAGIEISVTTPASDDPEPVVYSDAARIRQVLDNLLSNALKYTPAPGRVTVAIQTRISEEPPRNGSWLVIAVSDTGPGIPEEEIDRIFDEFHRVPGSKGKGHGLGLAISRRVARLLGGEVTVRSTLGQGATFLLWLAVREDKEEG